MQGRPGLDDPSSELSILSIRSIGILDFSFVIGLAIVAARPIASVSMSVDPPAACAFIVPSQAEIAAHRLDNTHRKEMRMNPVARPNEEQQMDVKPGIDVHTEGGPTRDAVGSWA